MGRAHRQALRARHTAHVLCSRSTAPVITGDLAAELPRPGMLGRALTGDCGAAGRVQAGGGRLGGRIDGDEDGSEAVLGADG